MAPAIRKGSLVALVVSTVAFAVYVRTLAPSIQYGDSPELTVAVYQLGVPHPTGYPLYTLVGHLLMRLLPFLSPAYCLNLFSALCAAAAVGVVTLVGLSVVRSRAASLVAALLLAFSLTFWSQAVITEVYALHALFMASVLYCVLKWDRSGDRRWLLAAAGLYGLSLTNHAQTVLLAPALLFFLMTSPRRRALRSEIGWLALLVLAPLLIYVYLPIAAFRDPPENWGDPRTLHNFWLHITGAQYRGQMGVRSVHELGQRLLEFAGPPIEDINPGHLFSEFSPFVIWLAPIGAYSLFRRRRRLFGLTVIYYVCTVVWALSYRIPDIEVYYIPSSMVLALWIGCGIRQIRAWTMLFWNRMERRAAKKRWLRPAINVLAGCLAAVVLAGNWQANDHRNDRSAIVMARTLLEFLKPNALVIGSGDDFLLPILYPHNVERLRPDVEILTLDDVVYRDRLRLITRRNSPGLIVNVPAKYASMPGGNRQSYRLMRELVADNLPHRPVYLLGAPDKVLLYLRDKLHVIPAYKPVRGPLIPLVEVVAKPD